MNDRAGASDVDERDAAGDYEVVEQHSIRAPATTLPLLLSATVALAVGGLLVLLVGVSPTAAYAALWRGAFGSRQSIGETLIRFVPLASIGLGLIPALRAGVFTVGAEGQVAMGALLAGLTALRLDGLPGIVLIPTAALAGIAGGAAWAFVPALLRARLHVNEILATLAFNFIGLFTLTWLLNGPARGSAANLPQTDITPEHSWLPALISGTRAHIGIVLVALLALAVLAFDRTAIGYRVRLYGSNPALANVAGVSARRLVMGTMLASGMTAGLAGWMQVAGVDRAVYASVTQGIGFVGLLVAVLGNLTVAGTLVAALFFAALSSGGEYMQIEAGVSTQLIGAIQGLALLIVAARIFQRRQR